MRGIIVTNGFQNGPKFKEPATMMKEAADRRGIQLDSFANSDLAFPVGDRASLERALGEPDFVVFWDKDVTLARNLELCGYPVFNCSECIRICDDKALTHLMLSEYGVPSVRTISCPMSFEGVGYGDRSFLRSVASQLGFPMVVKDCQGSFGMQVSMVHDMAELETVLKDVRPRIFQEYVECGGTDIRLEMVGEECVSAVRRIAKEGEFRANATLGGRMEGYAPTDEDVEVALRACEAVDADFAGVDILRTDNGPVVCEVNSNAHIRNISECTGDDVAGSILDYIKGAL